MSAISSSFYDIIFHIFANWKGNENSKLLRANSPTVKQPIRQQILFIIAIIICLFSCSSKWNWLLLNDGEDDKMSNGKTKWHLIKLKGKRMLNFHFNFAFCCVWLEIPILSMILTWFQMLSLFQACLRACTAMVPALRQKTNSHSINFHFVFLFFFYWKWWVWNWKLRQFDAEDDGRSSSRSLNNNKMREVRVWKRSKLIGKKIPLPFPSMQCLSSFFWWSLKTEYRANVSNYSPFLF